MDATMSNNADQSTRPATTENDSTTESNTPTPSYRKKFITQEACKSIVWKNGLGETQEIAIHPSSGGFYAETYTWRLALVHFNASCSFSLTPGHDCTFVLLEDSDGSVGGEKSTVSLSHRGEESRQEVKPLFPYTYSGNGPTTAQLNGDYAAALILSVDHQNARTQTTIETLGVDGCHDDTTGRRLLVGPYTILYILRGNVRVVLDDDESGIARKGDTVVIDRQCDGSPTELQLLVTDEQDVSESGPVVVVMKILQETSSSPEPSRNPPRRKGSIIIFDDQPMWNLPREVADGMGTNGQPLFSPSLAGPQGGILGSNQSLHVQHWDPAMQYQPPKFSTRHQNESDVPPPVIKDKLVIEEFPEGAISTAWINMVKNGLSEWVRIPVIVARGVDSGPVIGVTAAVHGNELNGVPCIHRVITDIDVHELRGTVVAIPCVNTPGYLRFMREFPDGKDLNRAFPGKEDGMASQVYAYQLMRKILCNFDYLIDLHTASFGRVNSYYVRADMNDPVVAVLAQLQAPQVILHNSGQDGTMRSAVHTRGIKSITVEIGNPQQFQNQFVQWSYQGVMRILQHLNMFTKEQTAELNAPTVSNTVVCSKGFWIYTRTGGVLEVYPLVNSFVRRGDLIARIKNIFGNIVDEYYAPCTGITIGRSSNPVAMAGDRIVHMGVIKKKSEPFAKEAKENY